jgi:hypothetical protein
MVGKNLRLVSRGKGLRRLSPRCLLCTRDVALGAGPCPTVLYRHMVPIFDRRAKALLVFRFGHEIQVGSHTDSRDREVRELGADW